MTQVVKLRKGLDISLVGRAEKVLTPLQQTEEYALTPDDFHGITPKMLVKSGDNVKVGSPIFFDKHRPNLIFTSPVSGVVKDINRGDKRKILNITITSDNVNEREKFDVGNLSDLNAMQIKELILASGLWPMIIQRPYGIIADENITPKSIFISLFDTAPLGVDMDYILEKQHDEFSKGIEVLNKLTDGSIHFGTSSNTSSQIVSIANKIGKTTMFAGKHPAGLVGVQINNTHPIAKGDIIWSIDAQSVAMIGRFFMNGFVDFSKTIAICGSEVEKPKYQRVIIGANIRSILNNSVNLGDNNRIICGNVLSGIKVNIDGYLSYYNNQITVIPEGDKYEFLGWIAPRLNKFSVSRSYFSWLFPNKKYSLDTNTNGDERALVMTGEYEKVFPMNIYPVYLLKAILAKDIDKMENLGIYEVIPEDFALCEFICTSKIPVQKIVREGLDLMIKELN